MNSLPDVELFLCFRYSPPPHWDRSYDRQQGHGPGADGEVLGIPQLHFRLQHREVACASGDLRTPAVDTGIPCGITRTGINCNSNASTILRGYQPRDNFKVWPKSKSLCLLADGLSESFDSNLY